VIGTTPTFICLDDNHVLWQYINYDANDVGIHGCHDRRRCQNSARDAIAWYGINRESGINEVNNMTKRRKLGGQIHYYYRGKYRIGKILSHTGSGMITQKEAQRNFGDRYKYIKVARYGVYGVPK